MFLNQSVVRRFLLTLCAASVLAAPIGIAYAQSAYPDKPVRMVVPYPPGGVTDIQGRILANQLGKVLRGTFVVVNQGGAGGRIGAEMVAKAPADGYTLLLGTPGPLITLPALSNNMPYKVQDDFAAVGHIATMANIMVVNPKSQFTSLQRLIAQEKAKPGSVRFGSAGIGSSGHVAGALLNSIAGIQMQHIPFKGSGPALIDLIGGNIDVMFDGLPSALPHIKSGRLRGVVLLSNKRSSIAPQFETTAEVGMPEFVIGSGTGVLAPKGTSQAVISTLERALKSVAEDPKYVEEYVAQGAEIDYMTADQYRAFIASETKRTAVLGKQAGIVLE